MMAESLRAMAESLRRAPPTAAEAAENELQSRSRTLSNLLQNAPKYDGSSEITLWKKRVMEYLRRRKVSDELMMVDVLQEACQKGASDFLGSLEWPIESVDQFWEVMESRFETDPLTRMADFDLLR